MRDGTLIDVSWPGQFPPPPAARRPPPLDAAVAWLKWADPRPWGVRPVLAPLGALVVAVVVGSLLVLVAPASGNGRFAFAVVINFAFEALLAAGIWFGGRTVARRYGTWRMFGWQRIRWRHVGYAAVGFVVAFGARIFVVLIANGATHGRAAREASNLPEQHISGAALVLLAVLVVGCAPLLEEVMFRGLMLRTFMRRTTFWPAALLSSAIFGVAHVYEVSSLLGAVVLALGAGTIGLVNAVLVRLTDSLAPGILVHAATNGLAVLVLAYR